METNSERPRRHVGTVTLGLYCIAAGGCMLGYYFVPGFDPILAAKLAPLGLVALGSELLYDAARPQRVTISALSIFLCLFLMAGVFCAAFVPVAWDWTTRREWNGQAPSIVVNTDAGNFW